VAVGAIEHKDRELFTTWNYLLDAFEAGVWLFYITASEIAIVTVPQVSVDEQRRLHHAQNAAFVCLEDIRDYYWHGVLVPEQVILSPETLVVEQIESERNIEVRRVMIERFGWGRYIEATGAEQVSTDRFGTLYRKKVEGIEPSYVVHVTCPSTERPYWLPVGTRNELMGDREFQTAHEAVAWSFGFRPEQYNPKFET
jgi:hypothetical protein